MTIPKLPTEAELEKMLHEWLKPPAEFVRLVALGREYYALRRKLRALLSKCPWDRRFPAEEIEALLGDGET